MGQERPGIFAADGSIATGIASSTVCMSERERQRERCGTQDEGKGFDTFGLIGPWLVTSDEIPDRDAAPRAGSRLDTYARYREC